MGGGIEPVWTFYGQGRGVNFVQTSFMDGPYVCCTGFIRGVLINELVSFG